MKVEFDEESGLPVTPVKLNWRMLAAAGFEFASSVFEDLSELMDAVSYLITQDFKARAIENNEWQEVGQLIERIPDDPRDIS